MELRHIRYFLAVAEERNFTRAARAVGIGQPPLSQQIRDLEAEVGARLFHRVPHGAELTEAGLAFLRAVEPIPADVAAAVRSAQRAARGETGSLRIGFTGSAVFNPLVPGAMRAFRRRYPAVELSLVERNSLALADAVRDESLDAAFLRPAALNLDGLVVHELDEESMVAAVPSGHSALEGGNGETLSLARLKDDPFILTPRAVGPSVFDAVVDACRAVGFQPIMGQTAPQMASLLTLVAAELGVSVVLASMRQVAPKGAAFRQIEEPLPTVRLALAHRKVPGQSIRNFVALLRR